MTAISHIDKAHDGSIPPYALRIFDQVPHRFGVIAIPPNDGCGLIQGGEVAVYDELDLHFNELEEGGLYVVEYQRVRSGMSDEMRALLNARLEVTRHVVRIRRDRRQPDHWWTVPLRKEIQNGRGRTKSVVCSDGPWPDFQLTDKVIGKVVGIYRPHLS